MSTDNIDGLLITTSDEEDYEEEGAAGGRKKRKRRERSSSPGKNPVARRKDDGDDENPQFGPFAAPGGEGLEETGGSPRGGDVSGQSRGTKTLGGNQGEGKCGSSLSC
jgi:hypothetical protein